MSNPSIELEMFYENDNINYINNSSNLYEDPFNKLNISSIYKSKFAEPYHFLCKICNHVPIIRFLLTNKIIYICECKESPRQLKVKYIYNYLYHSDKSDLAYKKLNCYRHQDEKYSYYCEHCKKNLCAQCYDDCIEHQDEIKVIALKKNSISKNNYISQKIKDKIEYYNDIDNNFDLEKEEYKVVCKIKLISEENNNNISNSINEINSNYDLLEGEKSFDDGSYLIQKEDANPFNEDDKKEFINFMGKNIDELYEDEYYYIN